MTGYIDSSVALRWLLKSPGAYKRFHEWDALVSSELLWIECLRVLHRLRLEGRIGDAAFGAICGRLREFYDDISIAPLTDAVKERAADAFPTIVGTLDALHLATALMIRTDTKSDVHFITHDEQLARAAKAESFTIHGLA